MDDNTYFRRQRARKRLLLKILEHPFQHTHLPKWQKEIIFKYPDIYLKPNPEIELRYVFENKKSFCNLRYGFEFEEGWKGLADEFSSVADKLVKALHRFEIRRNAYIRAFIFKEKHGRLRWQGSHNLSEPFQTLYQTHVRDLISKSEHVCEVTGKPGRLRHTPVGWKTLCREEYDRVESYFGNL